MVGSLHHVGLSVHLVLPSGQLGLHLIEKSIVSLGLAGNLRPVPGLGATFGIGLQTLILWRRDSCKAGFSLIIMIDVGDYKIFATF